MDPLETKIKRVLLYPRKNNMGILNDIQNEQELDIQKCLEKLVELSNPSQRNQDLKNLKESVNERLKNIDKIINKYKPNKLQQLIDEQTIKEEMENNTWEIKTTIQLLTIDELIKKSDFPNHIAYENHKANIIRNTPDELYPGYQITVQVGIYKCHIRQVKPIASKQEAMRTPEFIRAVNNCLKKIQEKSA